MRTDSQALMVVVSLSGLLLAGCAATEPPSTGTDHASPTTHVHAIVADPAGDGFLLGTHEGIYAVAADGELLSRVSGYEFDAMGLTRVGDDLLASGHPGANTPVEMGSPHLGIIRSTDAGRNWAPVAFTGEKDFHALTASPDGNVFGIATDSQAVQVSTDGGTSWSPTGAQMMAVSLAATAGGGVVAATQDGIQVSTDEGRSFRPWTNAPLIFRLSTSPDGEKIAGVDANERIWVHEIGEIGWQEAGTIHGTAQAISLTNDGDVLVADDSGLTFLPATP